MATLRTQGPRGERPAGRGGEGPAGRASAIPEATVARLPVYLRALRALAERGNTRLRQWPSK